MSKYTSEEMGARITAALDGYDGQTAGYGEDPAGVSVDTSIDPSSVDRPLGANGGRWEDVAEGAWKILTGETKLPDWFDDLATVGELARESGKTRDEVTEALDASRPPVPSGCGCALCVWQRVGAEMGWFGDVQAVLSARAGQAAATIQEMLETVTGVSPVERIRAQESDRAAQAEAAINDYGRLLRERMEDRWSARPRVAYDGGPETTGIDRSAAERLREQYFGRGRLYGQEVVDRQALGPDLWGSVSDPVRSPPIFGAGGLQISWSTVNAADPVAPTPEELAAGPDLLGPGWERTTLDLSGWARPADETTFNTAEFSVGWDPNGSALVSAEQAAEWLEDFRLVFAEPVTRATDAFDALAQIAARPEARPARGARAIRRCQTERPGHESPHGPQQTRRRR